MTAPLCTCPDRGEPDWNGHHEDACPWLVWERSQQSEDAAQLRKERDAARWADETRRKACEALSKERDAALADLRALADQLEAARAEIARLRPIVEAVAGASVDQSIGSVKVYSVGERVTAQYLPVAASEAVRKR